VAAIRIRHARYAVEVVFVEPRFEGFVGDDDPATEADGG
jgi:hypothetical protein